MKKLLFLFASLVLISCQNEKPSNQSAVNSFTAGEKVDSTDRTNNFYDNEELFPLKMTELEINGEVINPGKVDFSNLPKRSIIVKEALPGKDGNDFVGAFRYDGYSLFDILNLHTPDKNNKEAFPPIIDLYITIENDLGEKAVFSWGEVYYPIHQHEIIYATNVMRIVPSKTKELWPLPTDAKIIAGADLLTSRNISNPTKITVRTASREFVINKGMSPMYVEQVDVFVDGKNTLSITAPNKALQDVKYETIFYGRGRGIHSTTPFTGQMLKEVMAGQIEYSAENIKEAYLIFAAKDGYRCVYSYSEIFNRNDQAEVLLINNADDHDGGAFRLFPASDFFSDRAIKSVDRIFFEQID